MTVTPKDIDESQNARQYQNAPQYLPPAGVEPLIYTQAPITSRISYFWKLWSLKIVQRVGFAVIRTLKPTPKRIRPSFLKAYPCRPHLRNRIFIPQSRQPWEQLPLYLDLHAGGHALCDAQFDDGFCAALADRLNILVISIEYSRAPRSRFPEPTNDVVAITRAIIEDDDLPIDKTRVVLGGFSAGGNLALSAAQFQDLKNKICAVVCWYPVTDFSLSSFAKQNSRPYRSKRDTDGLKDWAPLWQWAYIQPGQDVRDPLLSVRYAKAESLPRWIYMIGAQYDMLANEARSTIFDIASLDEQERLDGQDGFEKGTYKWKLVKNVKHAFTHNIMDGRSKEVEAIDRMRTEQMILSVGEVMATGFLIFFVFVLEKISPSSSYGPMTPPTRASFTHSAHSQTWTMLTPLASSGYLVALWETHKHIHDLDQNAPSVFARIASLPMKKRQRFIQNTTKSQVGQLYDYAAEMHSIFYFSLPEL